MLLIKAVSIKYDMNSEKCVSLWLNLIFLYQKLPNKLYKRGAEIQYIHSEYYCINYINNYFLSGSII